MDVLADTNILIRGVHRKAAQHREALGALRILRDNGDRVCVVPQNLYEFWSAATRPLEVNGLSLLPAQANRITSRIEQMFALLRDTPSVYDEWRRMVATHAASGKASHDTRLVAAMKVHRVT